MTDKKLAKQGERHPGHIALFLLVALLALLAGAYGANAKNVANATLAGANVSNTTNAAYAGQMDAAHRAVSAAAAGRIEEARCHQLIGVDEHLCNSYATCQYACYSVTSFCYPIALGSTSTFIYQIWEYANASRQLDGALNAEAAAYARDRADASARALEDYMQAYDEVNRQVAKIAYSPLTNWLCAEPAYGLENLTIGRVGLGRAAEAAGANGGAGNGSANAAAQNNSDSTSCSVRIVRAIRSGASQTTMQVRLDAGDCALGPFRFSDSIATSFSHDDPAQISYSLAPTSVDGAQVSWSLPGLPAGQVMELDYKVGYWVGSTKVNDFSPGTVRLLATPGNANNATNPALAVKEEAGRAKMNVTTGANESGAPLAGGTAAVANGSGSAPAVVDGSAVAQASNGSQSAGGNGSAAAQAAINGGAEASNAGNMAGGGQTSTTSKNSGAPSAPPALDLVWPGLLVFATAGAAVALWLSWKKKGRQGLRGV